MSCLFLNAIRFAIDIITSYGVTQLVPTSSNESRNMEQAVRQYVTLQPLGKHRCLAVKVDAPMILCDRLEANLTATIWSKLPNAVLHEALEASAEAVDA